MTARRAVPALFLLALALAASAAAAGVPLPLAFSRPAGPADAAPRSWAPPLRATRRIAVAPGAAGGRLQLYLGRASGDELCLAAGYGARYWGGTCEGRTDLCLTEACGSGGVGPQPLFWTLADRVLAGVAGDRVLRVRLVGRDGRARALPLTADHGFVELCGVTGCGCEVARLVAYDGARVLGADDLRQPDGRLTWCGLDVASVLQPVTGAQVVGLSTEQGVSFFAFLQGADICLAASASPAQPAPAAFRCESHALPGFPSPERPLLQAPRAAAGVLAGLAADGVARVEAITAGGARVADRPTRNMYVLRLPRGAATTQLVARNAAGDVVYATRPSPSR